MNPLPPSLLTGVVKAALWVALPVTLLVPVITGLLTALALWLALLMQIAAHLLLVTAALLGGALLLGLAGSLRRQFSRRRPRGDGQPQV